MMKPITISEAARRSGLPAKTIRFYEDEGLLPAAKRNNSGYRLYSEGDVARLALVRRAKVLGLSLPEVRALVDRAFDADCVAFADELLATIEHRRSEIASRIAELEALHHELEALERHVRHCCEGCEPEQMSSECGFCGLIEAEKGGDRG